jgi:hypothetical protein
MFRHVFIRNFARKHPLQVKPWFNLCAVTLYAKPFKTQVVFRVFTNLFFGENKHILIQELTCAKSGENRINTGRASPRKARQTVKNGVKT